MDDVVAAAVPGRYHHAGGGPEGRDFAAVVVGSDAEEIHIGADDLFVVGRVSPRLHAFVVQFRRLDIEIQRQMAAGAGGLPGRMAGEALDFLRGMGQVLSIGSALTHAAVLEHQLGP